MKLAQSTVQPVRLHEAADRIEGWLLRGGAQIDEGAQEGGIVGGLGPDGKPEFVYLEVAGYFLTTMAWLTSGTARTPEDIDTARVRAHRAAGWIGNLLSGPGVPPTRLYLSDQPADWRNGGVFSFDLAMAARGVAVTRHGLGRHERLKALTGLCAMIDRISRDTDVMTSHEPVTGSATTMPDRWSTRPGPHHLKAAAAVLQVPERIVGPELLGVAQRTCEHWAASLQADAWPCEELHAVLYGLEGMLIRAGSDGVDGLRDVERPFVRLMDMQASDGTLPETVHGGTVRSDVLAQALRVGLLLRGRGYLAGSIWAERLDRLTDALLGYVLPDGAVMFSSDQAVANSWCAMFAHQALYLAARQSLAEPVPVVALELLV